MSEAETIRQAGSGPATVESLLADLSELGVGDRSVVCVHSSLSAMGWVCGGAQAVVEALVRVLGPEGTLVMPTHTTGNSEPSYWVHPPVPEEWWDSIRASMPAFDPVVTPTRGMGSIVECFRTWPGVVRSRHPQESFAALGPQAESVVEGHGLNFALGEESPLARLYEMNASILLLGVGHGSNTSLHLAEYRASWKGKREIDQGAAMMVDGRREWVRYRDIDAISDDFVRLGADYEGPERRGRVGLADSALLLQRPLVDFAVDWMRRHR